MPYCKKNLNITSFSLDTPHNEERKQGHGAGMLKVLEKITCSLYWVIFKKNDTLIKNKNKRETDDWTCKCFNSSKIICVFCVKVNMKQNLKPIRNVTLRQKGGI